MAAIHAPHFRHASSVRRGGIWMAAFDVGTLGARTPFRRAPGSSEWHTSHRSLGIGRGRDADPLRAGPDSHEQHIKCCSARAESCGSAPRSRPIPKHILDMPGAEIHASTHTKSPRGRLGAISFYSSFSSGISTSIESIRSSLPSIRSAKPPHSGHITWKRSCVNS